jgi:hypothetical protein
VGYTQGRRRLVLLRRDDVEHLVILSPTGETVVETGIPVPPAAETRAEARAEPRKAANGLRAIVRGRNEGDAR